MWRVLRNVDGGLRKGGAYVIPLIWLLPKTKIQPDVYTTKVVATILENQVLEMGPTRLQELPSISTGIRRTNWK